MENYFNNHTATKLTGIAIVEKTLTSVTGIAEQEGI
jgi:hypothetical protein